jgi:uncharacterized hydrophobic protein (TIGR00271 family)
VNPAAQLSKGRTMSIAILIPDKWEPTTLVQWSAMFARAKGEDLLVICAKRRKNPQQRRNQPPNIETDESPLAVALRQNASDFTVVDLRMKNREVDVAAKTPRNVADRPPLLFVKEIDHSDLVPGVLKEIRERRVKQLIVPQQWGVRTSEEDFAAERRLFLEAPCETLQLRPGESAGCEIGSVLVATSGSKHSKSALHVAAAFVNDNQRNVTALFVEQPAATPRKTLKNNKKIDRGVRRSLKSDAQCVTRDMVADEDVSRGVSLYANQRGHEVVVVGAGRHFVDERRLPISVPEKLLSDMHDATVVVVRKAMPLAGRLLKAIERRKKSIVPQLDREGRIELVGRLESSANWDFDFVFLIFLATLIAALGLVLDSPPVVIGAMLVAPIMTPMLGLGLSVVQGNRRLANRCLSTIGRGFVVAMLTGCAAGLLRVLFTTGVTEQMSSRGAPGALDLAVAFVSGVVAAYAFGRPHLLSVLPGIAIATSLVPPIATVGLALSVLELNVAFGATLLFLSNATAIVLGSASALWIVGMRGPREICPFTEWAQRWMVGLLGLSICLAVFLTVRGSLAQTQVSSDGADVETSPARPENPALQPAQQIASEAAPNLAGATTNQEPVKRAAEENRKVRVVFKPPVTTGDQQSSGSITLILPTRSAAERGQSNATDTTVRPRRRRLLLRLFRPRQQVTPRSFDEAQQR